MGWLRRLLGLEQGRWREIRANYRDLPQEEWTDDEYDHWFNNLPEQEAWDQWDRWSRETYQHPKIKFLKRSCLDLAREAAKGSHPLEFGGVLRVEGDTVTELVLLPGTVQGEEHTLLQLWMQPVDSSLNGSIHSHPTPHPYPSDADFELFEQHGAIHLILGYPYGPNDWRAYSHDGVPTHLEVVD